MQEKQQPASGEATPPKASAADVGPNIGYRVQLPTFEGPLDLLLHLIEEHELNIFDIPIAFVAQKYVEYITIMQELNIDLASEYLVMAATLAHIKSKLLLPTPPAGQDDEQDAEADPRAELVRRLLEYQKYKNAAEALLARDLLGRDVFIRGQSLPQVEASAPLVGLNLFKLLDAFQAVLARARTKLDHEIDLEHFSITDRINELSDVLRAQPRLRFEELFPEVASRAELIITFLALLEMTRLRLTRLDQMGPLEPIYIELCVSEEAPSVPAFETPITGGENGDVEAYDAGARAFEATEDASSPSRDSISAASSDDEEPA